MPDGGRTVDDYGKEIGHIHNLLGRWVNRESETAMKWKVRLGHSHRDMMHLYDKCVLKTWVPIPNLGNF